ncbi:MAG: hypothetical protein HYU37_18035 [Acidobacteria bacterium]|nr:hypothetical protein [Acidobacteriota bacterium]
MPETPEQKARRTIDADLSAAGWKVQSRDELDLTAGRGIAVREFQMKPGFGFADYLLLRTNRHFTLKQSPIQRKDFDDFVACYKPGRLHERAETWSESNSEGRWRSFAYENLAKRDKLSLDLFWIKDKSLTDTDSLPPPDVLATEIADDLEAALEQFTKIAARLRNPPVP